MSPHDAHIVAAPRAAIQRHRPGSFSPPPAPENQPDSPAETSRAAPPRSAARRDKPRRTTRSEPCPVCGKPECSLIGDTLLLCWRGGATDAVGRDGAQWRRIGPGKAGGVLYAADGRDDSIRATVRRDALPATPSAEWTRRTERDVAHQEADARRRELALALGVNVRALEGLSVGWRPRAYGAGAYAYPHRTASGTITAIGFRLPDKRHRYDSATGCTARPGPIYIPGRWLTRSGPVFVVEGMSDTAAIDSIECDVVGHAGNRPSADLVVELVQMLARVPADRPIVVIAERDGDRSETSPGRIGATAYAQALAAGLDRPVGIAFAPDDAKDSRAWIGPAAGNDWARPTIDAVRARWLEHIEQTTTFTEPRHEPSEPCRLEPLTAAAPAVSLDAYRAQMRSALADWTDRRNQTGRVGILAGPAGCGKTRAVDEIAIGAYDRVTVVMPTHANLAERRQTIATALDCDAAEIAAYPRLDAESCASFTEEQAEELRSAGHRRATSAERAQALGFSPQLTACRGCPLSPWKQQQSAILAEFTGEETATTPCRYWQLHAQADAARVRLATHERLVRSPGTARADEGERHLVVIDESPAAVLFPVAEAHRAILADLAATLDTAADRMEHDEHEHRTRRRPTDCREDADRRAQADADTDRTIGYARHLAAVARSLADRLSAAAADRRFGVSNLDDLPPEPERPKRARQRLAEMLLRHAPDHLDGRALDLVHRLSRGEIVDAVAVIAEADGGERSNVPEERRRIIAAVLATWQTPIPEDADLLLCDATADRAALAARIGKPIQQIDPAARIERRTVAIQLPAELTSATSARKVAAALEQAVAALPADCRRIGVILHAAHRDRLFPRSRDGADIRTAGSAELVPDDILARLARDDAGQLQIEHWRGGRDRASNEWTRQCDALVVLGTPRPALTGVVAELLRRGEIAAAIAGSPWGAVEWEALDIHGRPVTCRGRGYTDERWGAAADAATRATLTQGIERARTILPTAEGGLPVIVVASEPAGLPIADALPPPVSRGARRIAAAVARIVERKAGESSESGKASNRPTTSAKSPIGRRLLLIEEMALVAEILAELADDGKPVPRRTALRWLADALADGLVVREGGRTTSGYRPPDPVPGAPPPPPVLEPADLEPVPEPVWIDRGPILDPVRIAVAATGPASPSPSLPWSATAPPVWMPSPMARGPTGPAG
jgi:hypothetical protein